MTDKSDIDAEQKALAFAERKYALAKVRERKKDAHRKIEFGGLVIKAGMQHYSKDVILGALLDAVFQLEHDDATHNLFQIKGHAAFLNYGGKKNG